MVDELSREELDEEVSADVLVRDDVVREVDERDEVRLVEESERSDSDELEREEVLELRDDVDLVPEDELVPESARSASCHKGHPRTHEPLRAKWASGRRDKQRATAPSARAWQAAPEIRCITWQGRPIDGECSMRDRAIGVCTDTV